MRITGRRFSKRGMALGLSSLVMPGAGQLYQRRWFAGVFYAAAFLPLAARFFWVNGAYLLKCFRAFYCMFTGRAWDSQATTSAGQEAFFWLFLCALVWAMNVLDVWMAGRRLAVREASAGSSRPLPPVLPKY